MSIQVSLDLCCLTNNIHLIVFFYHLQAATDKLKDEIEQFENPQIFPIDVF
jgi:hypothetical protein